MHDIRQDLSKGGHQPQPQQPVFWRKNLETRESEWRAIVISESGLLEIIPDFNREDNWRFSGDIPRHHPDLTLILILILLLSHLHLPTLFSSNRPPFLRESERRVPYQPHLFLLILSSSLLPFNSNRLKPIPNLPRQRWPKLSAA